MNLSSRTFPQIACDLASKTVLVTGASRGLGRAMALALAREGAFVCVGYYTHMKEADKTLYAIRASGGDADSYPFDVRDRRAVDRAVSEIVTAHGGLDVLVNSAGISGDGLAVTMPHDQWQRVLDVNLTGTFNCCRAAAMPMMSQKRGSIVNVASVAGLHASPGQSNYAAAKGGVLALTRTLAAELATYGIRVNAVVPGLIASGMAVRLDHRVLEAKRAGIALQRLGSAEEIAEVVAFLASDRASYIVGQAIVADGGMTL